MSCWNVIECGFNTDDQTLNFGTRLFAGNDLYEACTLACITSNNVSEQEPRMNPKFCIKSNKLFYAIEKTLGVFTDLNCTEIDLNINFDEAIDVLCITDNAKYALVGLSNGSFQFLDVEGKISLSEGNISENIGNEPIFIDGYLEHVADNEIVFIIITKTGDIYRLKMENLQENCSFHKKLVKQTHCIVKNAAFNYPYIFLNGSELIIYNLANDEEQSDDPLDILKVVGYDDDIFLMLDIHGNLIQICEKTLVRFYVAQTSFTNMIFLQDKKSGKDDCLLVASTNKDETGTIYLQSFESPLNVESPKFTLKHTNDIHLIVPGCMYSDYMFVTNIKKDRVSVEFRIQVVCETDAEKRLGRLLKRQRFDEAERFAKLFNLDGTLILKGRAAALIAKQECTTGDVHNLLQILDEIKDVEFKLQCCYDMHQCCKNVDDVHNVLEYAFSLLKNDFDRKEVGTLGNQIMDIRSRFNTFMLIQRYQTYLVWDDFAPHGMMELLHDYLQRGNIEIAILIYNQMDEKVTLEDVAKTLNILDTLPPVLHKPFIYSFIPVSLNHLPSSVIVFVKWLKQRVYRMEEINIEEFPQNAISFTDEVIKLLVHNNIEMESMRSLYRENVEDLSMLIKALNRLQFILENYNISVPLKEYLKGSKSLVHTLLNIRLSDENFNMFFDNFLYNFMLENNLRPDDVLLEEIETIICYEESYWADTVSRYLQKMSLVELKLQAINKIALIAKVPWSEFVKKITATAFQYDHPLARDIIQEIQNEPKKIALTKYNLQKYMKKSNVNTKSNLEYFVNRMLYCNLDTMIEDVFTICRTPMDRRLANRMLFDGLISKRRIEDALKVLYMIPAEDLFTFCRDITHIIRSKYNFKDIENYSPVLSCIKRQYKEKGCGYQYMENLDRTFNAIISYTYVKMIHADVTIDDLLYPKKRDVVYNILIEKAVYEFENNSGVAETLISQISKCLGVSKNDVMVKFVEKCSNSDIIQNCAEHYYLYEDDPDRLCKMAALIINSLGMDANTSMDVSARELTLSGAGDDATTISNIRLALKLVTKAILNEKGLNSFMYNQFLYLLKISFGVMTEKSMKKGAWSCVSATITENLTPSVRTLCCVKDLLKDYAVYTDFHNIPNTKHLSYFNSTDISLIEIDNNEILSKIKTTVQHLIMDGHIEAAYHLILFFLMRFTSKPEENENVISDLRTLLKQKCIPKVLGRVLASNVINYQYAFLLLISLDFQYFMSLAKQYIRLYKANPSKLNTIMQLVMKVFKYHKVTPDDSYVKLLLLSKWWQRIEDCQIPMKTFYISSAKELLHLLLKHNHLKLDMMEEFCKDFRLDLQICYEVYLEKLITTWNPNYEIIQTGDGKSKLVMKSTEDELYEKCKKVLTLIESKQSLQKYIETFCSSINFYHYEALLCLFKILSFLTNTTDHSDKQQLLTFLKMYTRVNKPSNLELEEWFALFPSSQNIDPLSKWRLPFSQIFFTEDVCKILRPEINLKTYTIWFKAIPFLHPSFNVDDICSFVVKDVVSSGILEKKSDSGWVLTPVHEDLFQEIDQCVQHISDIEMATSVINHLMLHTPNGADQVNAAQMCLKYAKQYRDSRSSTDSSVGYAFKKIWNKYLKYSVSHILHLCNLDSERYGDKLLDANELIHSLYMHEGIIKSANSVVLSCPDINKAVDDIAALYNIDVLKKRQELLETFLFSTSSEIFDLTHESITEDTESINLKRAAYVCQSGDLMYWLKYLLTMGIEGVHLSTRGRANSLKCLTMISDINTIETIVSLQYNAFVNYIDKLYLLSDLEQCGLSMTQEQLNDYNKNHLLRRLALDTHVPETVKIMGDVCMVYLIYDTMYWNKIIDASIKLNLYGHVKRYINFWSPHLEAKHKNFYIKAWQYVIDNAFIFNKELDVFNRCVKNILMIQSCPVLHFLNFKKVFREFCRIDRFDFAAVVIQYMPLGDQEELASEILNSTNNIPDLSPLEEYGICGIELVKALFTQ